MQFLKFKFQNNQLNIKYVLFTGNEIIEQYRELDSYSLDCGDEKEFLIFMHKETWKSVVSFHVSIVLFRLAIENVWSTIW